MDSKMDPMGRAILDYVKRPLDLGSLARQEGRAADYWKTKKAAIKREQSDACINSAEREQTRPKVKADRLRVFSPMFEEDEIPLRTLFRTYETMPKIERKALDLAKGKTLDVGAASGCHSLVLQKKGVDVTAIDISPLSVETMKQRGVKKVFEQDFFELGSQQHVFTLERQQYDTILMLMNGIGIVGTLDRMPEFFNQLDKILALGGQVLCDSSDISYVFESENGIIEYPDTDGYYGEQNFQMQYKDTIGEPFDWLYIDAETLKLVAEANGYTVEVVAEGEHYDYLARITKKIQ